jgi:hypothetical protein
MRRTDLAEAVLSGWARLDAAQRQRFFEAFVKAALRLDRLELRAWLRRRLQYPVVLQSIRPASYLRMPTLPAFCRRRAELTPGGSGTRPMAARNGCGVAQSPHNLLQSVGPGERASLHAGHACRPGNTRGAYERVLL